ncbi:hypothetical protein VSVS12_02723 [Vibrio scophthalmi]|uniref:hypothetical protein n=1 Tax=Vibrio scophthalmi TaxID=45658 RepID=UPI0008093156|nr:hypothetical protein [Vibrio scophthalmi]ANS86472.1 hypothetical protein VSVS12_02723 [Vibrio scophthalmi]
MNKQAINKLNKILIELKKDPVKNAELISNCIKAIERHEKDRQFWIERNNKYKNKYKYFDLKKKKEKDNE